MEAEQERQTTTGEGLVDGALPWVLSTWPVPWAAHITAQELAKLPAPAAGFLRLPLKPLFWSIFPDGRAATP